ncbi:hypothetical protein JCGZ_16543 [Jatropha curcas]|uniref:Glycosyltransferase n=1 Tax=Jatropha curcas TaxID=180498 RepID=A0A067KBF9_JATCU|nr:hypothetical protein JCGZ_16543 [Jatropha curcas]
MEDNQEKPHAILMPCPLQGHIIPFVHLAINLASKGFTITFINTEFTHYRITKATTSANNQEYYDIFTEARTQFGFDIRYRIVSDGFPLVFDRAVNREQFLKGMLYIFSAHVDDLVGKLEQNTKPKITCLLADTFYVWPSMVAKKYNLVNISFWTEPALDFSLYYHWDLLKINGHFGYYDNREDTRKYIPGVEAIEPKDLPSYLQDTQTTTMNKMIYKGYENVKEADFIICNTIQELEPKPISALNEKQPFYSIGPIFLLNGFTNISIPTSLWSESDCTQWLQPKPHGSVLYVSFGSVAHCSKKDIIEIAHGLLLSKVSFIWVLRNDIVSSDDDDDILPVGFEDEIRDKGLIVPWCCQISVISNPTVGGFLTHCGWNSVLESIWYSVPMLCYPIFTDQITNRKLVVDDWKVGLNFCDKKEIRRDEVSEKINRLMSGKSATDLRNNIKQVKKTLQDAVSTIGSSERNFNKFIGDVKAKISEAAK